MNITLVVLGVLIGLFSFIGVLVFGVLFIIKKYSNSETNKYKKPLISSAMLTIVSILLIISSVTIFGDKYPNEYPGTITKTQLTSLKEGMTREQLENKLGKPAIEDKEVDEWDYNGINGLSSDSTVMIFFDGDTVSSIVDDGLNQIINTDENKDTSDQEKTNFDYEISAEVAIEDSVGKTVDWNGKTQDVIREVTVNDNAGKNDGSKVVLLKLNAPIKITKNAIQKQVNKDSLNIVKSMLESSTFDAEINSITFFWYLPLTDKYGKDKEDLAYKIDLEKSTLNNLNLDNLNSIQLDSVADQYKILFN